MEGWTSVYPTRTEKRLGEASMEPPRSGPTNSTTSSSGRSQHANRRGAKVLQELA
jgi:hypothetical protein